MTFTISVEFIVHLLVNGLIILLLAMLLPFVTVKNYVVALYVAVMVAFVNLAIDWLLKAIEIDQNVSATFLFGFLINVVSFFIVDKLIAGFKIRGIIWTVLFAALVVVMNYLFVHYIMADVVLFIKQTFNIN